MSGRWNDDSLNCDFKSIHCKLDQFEKSLQSVTDNMSEDMVYEKSLGRASQSRRASPGGGCKCRCTAFLDTRTTSNPERDSLMQELRQELRDINNQKHELQEKMFGLEEAQRLSDNDTQMLQSQLESDWVRCLTVCLTVCLPQMLQSQLESDRVRCLTMLQSQLESDRVRCLSMLQSQLESDRVRCRQMEEENDELKEEISRLEIAMNNLPVGDGCNMRDTAAQIAQLLQSLNDDMVKAPELCNRLRMAAQQIMEGEKRLTNERTTRAMDQAEVQFLRTENQRLRELAFRSNMTAFQASVQLPQNQLQYQQQLLGQPLGPGGVCADPYAGAAGAAGAPKRRGLLSRVFGKKEPQEDTGPGTLQFQDGSLAQFDPAMTMQQQRLSVALQEDPSEAARRLTMLNQEKRKMSCCPR
ncbi:hypothetical protein FJT64_020071 [Amphibalanus amphitrite]|uniref:Uncharacterized protein n=1 Tax=Amphibalanus amphitrite TaxID=1232801 RepID=A0A6A4WY68_AMPAM|nr:hypothetical protein FJT64_020071 [Amphibalanus amphitrite]